MIKKIAITIIIISGFVALVFINACQKNEFTTNPSDKLSFSTDTVQFDTVFTNTGSSTNYFIIKNSNNKKAIVIDEIFLARGKNSVYRINIDGFPVSEMKNYELAPGDSIFIFVEVTINPGVNDMVEEDSVMFITNGNVQNVKLIAFGQNVTLINGQFITSDTTWTSAKPVLIYNSALVEENVTLTVLQGTKVYFHRGSTLFVKGTLKVNGGINERVVFAGDRLELYYEEMAGQWGGFLDDGNGNTTWIFGGIHLLAGSKNSVIFNADIKNSIIGLQVDSCVTPGIPTVKLKNTNIENSKVAGLLAQDGQIEAENCVIANSGQYNLFMRGGSYSFTHCTFANYWIGNRQTPQLVLSNYYTYTNNLGATAVSYRDLTNAYFGNCIITGARDSEIELDLTTGALANFKFDNCLIKQKDYESLESSNFFIDNIWNKNPKFMETLTPFDYELDSLSPAKDAGKLSIGVLAPLDQNGSSRLSDGKPDLGAYERQE